MPEIEHESAVYKINALHTISLASKLTIFVNAPQGLTYSLMTVDRDPWSFYSVRDLTGGVITIARVTPTPHTSISPRQHHAPCG